MSGSSEPLTSGRCATSLPGRLAGSLPTLSVLPPISTVNLGVALSAASMDAREEDYSPGKRANTCPTASSIEGISSARINTFWWIFKLYNNFNYIRVRGFILNGAPNFDHSE
jgi:hypothetical protein